MESMDERIARVKEKIEDVKKRWPFHSVQPALYRELEELETELEELQQVQKEKGHRE